MLSTPELVRVSLINTARIQHHTNAISHVIPLVPPKAAHVAKPARILNIAVAQ
jgi:hypothetical protein